jgi:recombination protein RecA
MEINKVIADIEKNFGKGAVISFEDGVEDVVTHSSGCLSLDVALGGGYPEGRIVEMFGEESTGKTTLAIHACIEIQKEGKVAAYIDVENAFDKNYAEGLGLDMSREKLIFSQPDSGEEAFGIAEKLLNIDHIGIIVFDSVSALTPKAEIDGNFGDSKMGLHARLMSQSMRKLCSKIKQSGAIVFFINQMRDIIGVAFGDSKTTTGGNALKFYATQRVRLYTAGKKKDGADVPQVISVGVKAKVIKNKIAPPYREAIFDIRFGEGIDKTQNLIELAVEQEIIKKAGSWYSYGDVRLGQGEEAVRTLLLDNIELTEELDHKVRVNYGLIQE